MNYLGNVLRQAGVCFGSTQQQTLEGLAEAVVSEGVCRQALEGLAVAVVSENVYRTTH